MNHRPSRPASLHTVIAAYKRALAAYNRAMQTWASSEGIADQQESLRESIQASSLACEQFLVFYIPQLQITNPQDRIDWRSKHPNFENLLRVIDTYASPRPDP